MKTKQNYQIMKLERCLDFSRKDYENLQNVVSFEEFLENIIQTVEENNGSLEDAIFIANDAYNKLQKY